ncbi:hypothetical protein LSUB1_G001215 [Lachnellula subtilissima]|uniref:N-acetyltransferase domain-containing protein n=1 Tax=Lachnellula subtilissima TaxID=602034 RepID=A0A8H8RX25_9HELO|nr:hypothetical protein LSUB1_G001215 [Lachnellula subtilissima]
MPLKLQEMELGDFDTMTDHANIYPPGDDLVSPPTTICWLVTTQPEARNRLEFHMTKQKEQGIHWETHNAVEGWPWPKGMNVELHNFIFTSRDAGRERWQEKGKPCWILMHLVTRASQRGKGAASLLIQWGVDRARKDGVLAYLEAGALAIPLYAKHGFRQVGDLVRMDLRGYGVNADFVAARMGLFPGVLVEGQAGEEAK